MDFIGAYSGGNTTLFGVLACSSEDHDVLASMVDVFVLDTDGLRLAGLQVNVFRRALRLILTCDYNFLTAWCGHLGASSSMPSLSLTAMRRRTETSGLLV